MPLSVVDSPQFQHLIAILDQRYQIPSRKHLSSKLLPDESNEIQNKVKTCLEQAPSVCLTMDLWSNRQMKGFLGMTAHFIQNWTLQSVMLACKRFKGRHTAENIRHEYEETVSAFEISHKITAIVTDNASNMIKAFDFSLPGYEDDNTSAEDDSDDENADIESVDTTNTNEFECLPHHTACYAHTLQLVVKDGLKDANSHLKTIITKASTLVRFVRHSIHATEILEEEKRLQNANATRWNSQLIMIRSILNIPEEKLNKLDTVHLTTYERKLLQELCTVLKPFEHATQLVQHEKSVTASMTIPVTRGLQHQLQQISAVYNMKMVTTLKTSIDRRLSHYGQDDVFITAAVLDPRFKLRWCTPQEQSIVKSTFLSSAAAHQTISSSQVNLCSPPPAKKAKTDESEDFFGFMTTTVMPSTSKSTDSSTEVNRYLSQPCLAMETDPLQFWMSQQQNSPVLSAMACKFLTIPASSAPVERLFSIGGKIFRPERCRLADKTFERLMNIKCNSKVSPQ